MDHFKKSNSLFNFDIFAHYFYDYCNIFLD
jgi:hypothetical protein